MKKLILISLIVGMLVLSGCGPKTEVTNKGLVRGSKIVISPTVDEKVAGIITVELKSAPADTQAVAFVLQEGTVQMGENKGGPNLPFDTDGSDGWSVMIDTTQYENGLYTLGAVAGVDFGEGSAPPLDAASAQIIIEN